MPRNVFLPQNQGEMQLKRNSFDLSKSSVFTSDFFKLYPHFCQEVIPGDTFEIDAQVGMRALPTVFPVQTRVRISQEFYYVRNRTLQDHFEDMIFKTKSVEHPWLRLNSSRAKRMVSVGSLGDAFNVPSTRAVGDEVEFILTFEGVGHSELGIAYSHNSSSVFLAHNDTLPFVPGSSTYVDAAFAYTLSNSISFVPDTLLLDFVSQIGLNVDASSQAMYRCAVVFDLKTDDGVKTYISRFFPFDFRNVSGGSTTPNFDFQIPSDFLQHILDLSYNHSFKLAIIGSNFVNGQLAGLGLLTNVSRVAYSSTFLRSFDEVKDATDDEVISSNPFVGENPRVRLNALPFRGYEMICNYFYRFDKNNPYVLGGEAQYNEFIPTHGDGPDDNLYDFHYRNWELDRFTSALQSPQFGLAPLVGLIWTGANTVETTFEADDGKEYKVSLGVDADDNVDSILDFSGDVPSADLQRLQRRIQAGFSINDLRITNSFQRFLENVLRRGLRYRNQLKSHFGTDVDYPDIDVPQYIGGSSSYLDSGQVTNMAQGQAVLGDYNGTLQGGTATGNKIRCYCPEHGFIIGIVSITPIPSYAQSISKHMIKRDAFDYFLPEFGKVGFVPIHYSEVSPLQNLSSEGQDLSDVFGYQKAWYDYMESLDEVHGDFRTTLRDFVLTRTFKERPELGSAFTVGDPDQLNDIFVTTKIADKYGSSAKFLCSARFHVNALRPIAMVGTPSLE